jgi:uracil-DNA glycosylase family 4
MADDITISPDNKGSPGPNLDSLAPIQNMIEFNKNLDNCKTCVLADIDYNVKNVEKGHGKLYGFYVGSFEGKIMLVGLNPSYRRFPNIQCAFGGDVPHSGTGSDFVKLLQELNLLDKVYITNLVKCSAKGNKVDSKYLDYCYDNFKKELDIVKPKMIIALGTPVYSYLQHVLPVEYLTNLKHIFHPTYWSGYHKMSKQNYADMILALIHD